MSSADNIAVCEDFTSWFPQQQPKEYAEHYEFIERDLCAYYLFINNLPKLRERMGIITQSPARGIDVITMKLYIQLLYHGHYEDALQYAKKVYWPLKNSHNIMGEPEVLFLGGFYMNVLQNTYKKFGESGEFSLSEVNKLSSEFKPVENESGFKDLINGLKNPLNASDILESFKTSYSRGFMKLQAHFFKYMLDNHDIPFILSNLFWNIIADKDLFGQSKTSDEFFYIDVNRFDEMLDYRLDNFFDSELEIFGKVWSLHYIYEFLEANELVSADAAKLMRKNNNYFRNEMIGYVHSELWQMSFIFNWPGSEHWDDLKPMFENTFNQTYDETRKIVYEYRQANPVNERIKGELKPKEKPQIQDWLFSDQPYNQPYVETEPDVGRNDGSIAFISLPSFVLV
jgi:hypothetical protein